MINPEYVITLQGQQYCTYRGVLDCAHNLGLEGIRTRILQVPDANNEHVAIVEAEVRMKDGRVFTDVADASPKNVHARLASALIRLASTRAKGRALRDAVNIGEALAEELPDLDSERSHDVHAGSAPRAHDTAPTPRPTAPAPRPMPAPSSATGGVATPPFALGLTHTAIAPTAVPEPPAAAHASAPEPEPAAAPAVAAPELASGDLVCSSDGCGRPVTQGQYGYSLRAFGVALCPACQRKRQAQGKSA